MRWGARVVMGVAVRRGAVPARSGCLRVATKTEQGFISDPASLGGGFTLDNFGAAWDAVDLGGAIVDSLSITLPGRRWPRLVGLLAGMPSRSCRSRSERSCWRLAVGGLTIPVAALVIPQFDQALALGYVDTRLGLIVVYGAFFASWSSLFFFAYFRDLPDDLLEAAAHRRRRRSGRLPVGGAAARPARGRGGLRAQRVPAMERAAPGTHHAAGRRRDHSHDCHRHVLDPVPDGVR